MASKAKALKHLYMMHKITIEGVQKALESGIITHEEYIWIVGEGK